MGRMHAAVASTFYHVRWSGCAAACVVHTMHVPWPPLVPRESMQNLRRGCGAGGRQTGCGNSVQYSIEPLQRMHCMMLMHTAGIKAWWFSAMNRCAGTWMDSNIYRQAVGQAKRACAPSAVRTPHRDGGDGGATRKPEPCTAASLAAEGRAAVGVRGWG